MINKDKTESEIIAQIKQSLGGYEEEYIPGSWETFFQKRKKNNRKIFLRIASGIAACLLLGYLGNNFILSDKKGIPAPATEQLVIVRQDTTVFDKLPKKETVLTLVTPTVSLRKESPAGIHSIASVAKQSPVVQKTAKPGIPVATSIQAAEPGTKTIASSTGKETPTAKTSTDTINQTTELPKEETTVAYSNQTITKEEKNIPALSRRKIRFGINFSPGVSSTQTSNSMNYMGGISADISLFSNFQLSTGLQVENQNVVKNMPGIVSSSSMPQNQTKTKLINLDLPVNVTWKFVSEKSHAYYVSAGLSSLVHLKQENSYTTYSQELSPVSSLVNGVEVKSYNVADQISVTQNSVTPDQTFNFAGRINFMVGFEKKLSDKLFIHFEPYAKFPTSGQAAGNMNYTTTGINFKISF